MIQLDLFEENEFNLIMAEVRKLRESSDSVRKSVFAKITEMQRVVKELQIKDIERSVK